VSILDQSYRLRGRTLDPENIMPLPEKSSPALAADAAGDPELAKLLQLVALVDKALAQRPHMNIKLSTNHTNDAEDVKK
jgi:hypothetical protein